MSTMKQMKDIMDILYETFHLPTKIVGPEEAIVGLHLFDFKPDSDLPQIRAISEFENYIGIPVKLQGKEEGMLLLGPSVNLRVTEKTVKQVEKELSVKEVAELVKYYSTFPVISFEKLNHVAVLAYYMLYQKRIVVEDIVEYNFYCVHAALSAKQRFMQILSTSRINETTHHSYESEKRIFECIKRGETKQLLKYLREPLDGEVGVLSVHDPLRSKKNVVITIAGLAARAIMEVGIVPEVAYALNDAYVQLLEETSDIENVNAIMVTMLCEYSDLVMEHKKNAYSKVVNNCIDYVYSHLYEEISVKEISENMHFNQNYLSRQFKQEVGKTISEFINYERVEEAKRLLAFSEASIIDIVTMLHFHDQSHFTRVFKRITGMTPKRYRDQY